VFPEVRSITINATMTNFDVQKFSKSVTLEVAPEDKFPLHIECICWDCDDGGPSNASGVYFAQHEFEEAISAKKPSIELRSHCWGWGSYKYRNVSHCSVEFEGIADIEYKGVERV
jgi:hypothetical protein